MTSPENPLPAAGVWQAVAKNLFDELRKAAAALYYASNNIANGNDSCHAFNAAQSAEMAVADAVLLWPAPQAVPMPGTAPVQEEPGPEKRWLNKYEHCGQQWEDEWSCCCNDDCPVCGKEIEPYESEEIDKQDA